MGESARATPTLPSATITPVTLSDGQSFTWANLDAGRHYRMIEVGTAGPPGRHRFRPGRMGGHGLRLRIRRATLIESDDNYFIGFLSTVDAGSVPAPGWSDCTVANSQIAEASLG